MKYEKPELTLTPAIRAIQTTDVTKHTNDSEDSSGTKTIVVGCYEDNE